jgi:hypothetical protein
MIRMRYCCLFGTENIWRIAASCRCASVPTPRADADEPGGEFRWKEKESLNSAKDMSK